MKRIFVQTLESRRLLSSVGLLSDHVLVVIGNQKSPNTITVGLAAGGGTIDVTVNGSLSTFTATDVKKVRINGGEKADTITIDETNGAFLYPTFIDAEAGNDVVTGGSGPEVIESGHGVDTITAGNGNDYVFGHGGDKITVGNGNDVVIGGDTASIGDDSITVGNGNDTVFGLAGGDTITLGSGNDNVYPSNDTINAGSGTDNIFEHADNNTINPGTGTVNQDPYPAYKALDRLNEIRDAVLDRVYWTDL
jgi:Ca2+-binding RTX toxin-like protein